MTIYTTICPEMETYHVCVYIDILYWFTGFPEPKEAVTFVELGPCLTH